MHLAHNTVSKRIASLAEKMEDALTREHVDRFFELARQRSVDLHTLLDQRRDIHAVPDGENSSAAKQLEDTLLQAVQDDHRMIRVARQRLSAMRQKIDQLLERKSTHRQIGTKYHKISGAGHLFSYNG